jgi:hypothetical protein
MIIRIFFLFFLFFCKFVYAKSAPWVGNSLQGVACEGGGQGYGPFDYTQRNNFKKELNLVVGAHFTPDVEGLVSGYRGTLVGDLDYTLRAWPNHHGALLSVIKYQLNVKNKIQKPTPSGVVAKLLSAPECYLQRAMHFSPNDPVIYSLYGHYLRKIGYLEDAVKYYEKAMEIDPGNAKFAYSFSLLLVDLKRYEDAVKYAKIAYQQKNTPKGLRKMLEKLGVWTE